MSAPLKNHNKKPLAYQTGIQDFYGTDFIVTPDVLIPRPETEQIIDIIKSLFGQPILPGIKPSPRKLNQNPIILDIGTGSGCIAITVKNIFPEAEVYASDISEKALKIARKNAENNGVTINLIISHLLDNVNVGPDLIIANLPYVDRDWEWLDKEALSYEPDIALYADRNGLGLIYELLDQLEFNQSKYLILEADPSQHEKIVKYATKKGFDHVETRGFALLFVSA